MTTTMRRISSVAARGLASTRVNAALSSRVSLRSATTTAAVQAGAGAPSLPWPQPLYSNNPHDPERYKFGKYVASPKAVAIVGAPMALGQPQVGVDQGPAYIRSGGLHERLAADGWKIEDQGDVNFDRLDEEGRAAAVKAAGTNDVAHSPLALNSLSVGHANYLVYKSAAKAAAENKFVLTLGGDHSIAVGSIAAILKAKPDTAIIWVDAHADINPPAASGSGNIHGMPLSFLMNIDNCRSTIAGFEWMVSEDIPILRPDRLTYIGLRDVDWAEKQIIRNLNIKAFTMKDVDHLGIAEVMARATQHLLPRTERPLHLTFDIDSIDPMFAPSTGTRVSGGLTYREAYYICEMAAETGLLSSMDLVEVNPSINNERQAETVSMAVGLCASALGNKIL